MTSTSPAIPAIPVIPAIPAIPAVRLKPGCEKRARRGHPWIYSNEVEMTAVARAIPAGTITRIETANGNPLGLAFFNPSPLISARLLYGVAADGIDAAYFEGRIRAALALREKLYDAPFYRLIHAEADGLPGLVIDRFGDTLAVQPNSAGAERALPVLLTALDETIRPETVVIRRDSPARTLEGLEIEPAAVVQGALKGEVALTENGASYIADLLAGQKTGWFYDHRDNRAFAAKLASGGRVLDSYCHTGGFAILAGVAGAESVLGVDRSELALALAEKAAVRNGVAERCQFVRGEVFETLERMRDKAERFDVVIADPPAFVKSRRDLESGLKGYRKLARLTASLVSSGGFLSIASCSHNVSAEDFLKEAARGIGLTGRPARLIRQAGAAPDHPIHPHLPESAYLKALVFQVD